MRVNLSSSYDDIIACSAMNDADEPWDMQTTNNTREASIIVGVSLDVRVGTKYKY